MTQLPRHIDDEVLSVLVDDQLSPQDTSQAQVHLDNCGVCQERLAELRSVATLLRQLPELELPRDFSLRPTAVTVPSNVLRLRNWYTATRVAAGALAAVFVFLAAGSLYLDSRSGLAPAAEPARPQVLSAPAAAASVAPRPQAPAIAAARPASSNVQPDDQVAAATSISPLPTPVPTPVPVVVAVASRAVGESPDGVAPWRLGALIAGILALLALLAAMRIRHRLQRAASHL